MTDSLTEMELLEWRQESKADEREIIAVFASCSTGISRSWNRTSASWLLYGVPNPSL